VARLFAFVDRTHLCHAKADRMKVMIHAHTTYSADGELHPAQLAAVALKKGFDAVLVSDHFEFA
jgi:hypothetical protein